MAEAIRAQISNYCRLSTIYHQGPMGSWAKGRTWLRHVYAGAGARMRARAWTLRLAWMCTEPCTCMEPQRHTGVTVTLHDCAESLEEGFLKEALLGANTFHLLDCIWSGAQISFYKHQVLFYSFKAISFHFAGKQASPVLALCNINIKTN